MKIPAFLEATYLADQKLAAFAVTCLSKIEEHISSNRMVFFPEYTDHSVLHIELTLQTSFDLTTKPARDLLTSADATVMAVAVALHDAGMHLTREGFLSLIAPGSRWKGVEFFDSTDWSSLWVDFYAEATRFDGRKLLQLFGEKYRPVRPLPTSDSSWEDFDYLLVGEFLRRHHPRLAHEIALYGMPAKDGASVEVCPTQTEEHKFIADIAGLVARSHGMDLRTCLEYLAQKYQNKINPRRVHVAYLSALLRIADYFQIQATRAPTARTDVASFQSQLSEQEWRVHQAVRDVHNTSTDPEAIVVVADPRDVETFLKLKNWLGGLQKELDQSWAILGEIYGLQSHNDLNLLGLTIRRVKSNLDDVSAFAKKVDFIPIKIAFEAANADLLKLLVAPLYGNNPGIALRELFQNSIDAVREFNDLASRNPRLFEINRIPQDADVCLQVNCDGEGQPLEVVISDRGVGMSPEIVQDYFLKAGASFRSSSAWRKDHEDIDGHSRVLRTGRFGVGALAAFLIGDEIEVTTRSALNASGYGVNFKARLDTESISLNRVNCPVGTEIRIKVPDHLRSEVSDIIPREWQKEISFSDQAGFYFLKTPSLKRKFSDRPPIEPKEWLPLSSDGVDIDWRCFSTEQFEKIFWTYSNRFPGLACNGIVVSQQEQSSLLETISCPNISVFDKDGLLPLTLQRTSLIGGLPFRDDLLRSIGEDLLAYAITEAPASQNDLWFSGRYEGFQKPLYGLYNPPWGLWLLGRDGFLLNEPNVLLAHDPERIILGLGGKSGFQNWGETICSSLPPRTLVGSILPNVFSDNSQSVKGSLQRALNGSFRPPFAVAVVGMATYIPVALLTKIEGLRPGQYMKAMLDKLRLLEPQNGWIRVDVGATSETLTKEIIQLPIEVDDMMVFQVLELGTWPKGEESTTDLFLREDANIENAREAYAAEAEQSKALGERWMEFCKTSCLPFKPSARHALRETADESLSAVLEARKAKVDQRNKKKEELAEGDLEYDDQP